MKLSAPAIASLDNLLRVLNTVGIDKVIIEPNKIRAIDEMKTVGTITDQNVPDLDGKVLAVNRVKVLKDRFSLGKAQGDVVVNATVDPSGNGISMLEVAAGRSKSQFRCANADAVKVPKTFNDAPAVEVLFSVKQVPLIAQADATMTTDGITVASKDGSAVTVELVDNNKDVYTFDIEKPAVTVPGAKGGSFVYKYPSKALLSLLREACKSSADDVKVLIGAQGILFVEVGGYRFFMLPQT